MGNGYKLLDDTSRIADCLRSLPNYQWNRHGYKGSYQITYILDSLFQPKQFVLLYIRLTMKESDWSRAFNQFTIACELDMINAISAADIAYIMSSSMSVWLLSPLECSPQKQNDRRLHCCFWGWIMWKMYNKTIIEFGFRMILWSIKTSCLCYLPQPCFGR